MRETQVTVSPAEQTAADKPKSEPEGTLGAAAEEKKSKVLYNLYVLAVPTLTEGDFNAIQNKITEALEKYQANIERTEKFNRRDLAYPIKKYSRAYEMNIYFWMEPRYIKNTENTLATIEKNNILRYILTKEEPRQLRQRKPAGFTKKMRVYTPKDADSQIISENHNAEQETKTRKKVLNETEGKKTTHEKERVTLDDIDKKLDEIMGNL